MRACVMGASTGGDTVLDYIPVAAFGCLVLLSSFLDHCRDGCGTEFAIPLFGYGFAGCPPPPISLHPHSDPTVTVKLHLLA